MTDKEYDLLEMLCDMWNQYCAESGHHFMSTGEGCFAMLHEYEVLKDIKANGAANIDWDKLQSLKP